MAAAVAVVPIGAACRRLGGPAAFHHCCFPARDDLAAVYRALAFPAVVFPAAACCPIHPGLAHQAVVCRLGHSASVFLIAVRHQDRAGFRRSAVHLAMAGPNRPAIPVLAATIDPAPEEAHSS